MGFASHLIFCPILRSDYLDSFQITNKFDYINLNSYLYIIKLNKTDMKALTYTITVLLALCLVAFVNVCMSGTTDLTASFIESRNHSTGLGYERDFVLFGFLLILLVVMNVVAIRASYKLITMK